MLKNKVVQSKIVQKLYKAKFYLDLGISQISWVSGKLPEIMAFIYLTKWFGYDLSKNVMIVFCVGVIVGLTVTGYLWKRSGLYDVEMKVNANKNPVQKVIYNAAKMVIKNGK